MGYAYGSFECSVSRSMITLLFKMSLPLVLYYFDHIFTKREMGVCYVKIGKDRNV